MTQANPTRSRRKQPKYERVKNHVLGKIASRSLQAGDILPPEQSLAGQLGVSRQTVRMVLSDLGSDGVVRRVQGKGTIINENQPHSAESQPWHLEKKLDVYGLVVPRVWGSRYPALLQGFGQFASKSEHQMLVCETGNDIHVQGNAIFQLVDKNVAGVAIVPVTKETSPTSAYQLRQLHARRIPAVYCHRRPTGLAAPLVSWPWEEVGRMAGKALMALGHRRVAFATSLVAFVEQILQGLRDVLDEHADELSDRDIYILPKIPSTEDAHQALDGLLRSPNRPTAIFASDMDISEIIYFVATQLGLRVPRDLSIIGFGPSWSPWQEEAGAMRKGLAMVAVDEVELGRKAAQLLDEMRAGQRPIDSDERIELPLELYEGSTLGPAHGSSTCGEPFVTGQRFEST